MSFYRSEVGILGRPPVNLYVFDVLRRDHHDLLDHTWEHRRAILETLDLAGASSGRVRPVTYTTDGEALWHAILGRGGEGACHKMASSRYTPGKRSRSWRKSKIRLAAWFPVAGWRPPTPSKPAAILVADTDRLAVAMNALPVDLRRMLAELLDKHGRRHPTGMISIPEGCLEAKIRYTSRTPTHGFLREPAAVDLRRAAYE